MQVWYERAAKHGSLEATIRVAALFKNLVPANHLGQLVWLGKLADSIGETDPPLLLFLASNWIDITGQFPRECTQMLYQFTQKAVEWVVPAAYFILACHLIAGFHGRQDKQGALHYLQEAARL